MPRELEGYREQLEDIMSVFAPKRVLSVSDVVRYTGLNYRTVVKRYSIDENGITTVQLARLLVHKK
jgi:hypothetical protein